MTIYHEQVYSNYGNKEEANGRRDTSEQSTFSFITSDTYPAAIDKFNYIYQNNRVPA